MMYSGPCGWQNKLNWLCRSRAYNMADEYTVLTHRLSCQIALVTCGSSLATGGQRWLGAVSKPGRVHGNLSLRAYLSVL